jgi:MFS family permease
MSQNLEPGLTPIEEIQFCAKHPQREASLRCIRCNRLMCTDCIVRTSVGYVCKECSRRQEDKFFSAGMQDYVLQAGACFIVMFVFSALLSQVGFASSFLAFILGPIAGGLAGEAAMRVTGRRRGRYTDIIGTAGAGIGGLLGHIAPILGQYQEIMSSVPVEMRAEAEQYLGGTLPQLIINGTVLDIWFLVFLGLALAGAYARLRGRI